MIESDMHCRLNGDLRVIDGYWWPGSYAAATLARYARMYGDGALLIGHVCEHVEAVHGWSPPLPDES